MLKVMVLVWKASSVTQLSYLFSLLELHTQGDTLQVAVNYNEEVDVTGNPTLAIASTGSTNPVTAAYASGTGTGRLVFEVTMPSETADISWALLLRQSLAGGTISQQGNFHCC